MKYTIAKIIFSKEVEGKYGPQQSVRFTTNETGGTSISTFSKYPLKEGQEIEGEIVEKPGTNKEGQDVIYHNFNFAKKGPLGGSGMSPEQFETIMRELRAINANILRVWAEVDPQKGHTSDGKPAPSFDRTYSEEELAGLGELANEFPE